MTQSTLAYDATSLIESNAHEAADLVGELTLLLDRVEVPDPTIAGARLVTRRIADRLAQMIWLRRVEGSAARIVADAWPPAELVEELAQEARALARGRLAVVEAVAAVVPQTWFFDRELVAGALRNVVHSAFVYARAEVTIGLRVQDGFLGLFVQDDGGAYPEHLLRADDAHSDPDRCNGNALGIHFARGVASAHRQGNRSGYVVLANRCDGPGTQFTIWLP